MLKKIFIVTMLLAATFSGRAQVTRLFLDTNRNVTPDSAKARFYAAKKN